MFEIFQDLYRILVEAGILDVTEMKKLVLDVKSKAKATKVNRTQSKKSNLY